MEIIKPTQIRKIIKLFKQGQIGVMPTDTIYGVHGLAQNQKVVERIYQLKIRSKKKPFIVLIHNLANLNLFGIKLDAQTREILKKVWPGKVSVILGSTAFRMPENDFLQKILAQTGPLISTSANLSGRDPAKNIEEARAIFEDQVDFYIDGGDLQASSSTVISLVRGKIKVLRQGEVSLANLLPARVNKKTKDQDH